MNMKIYLTNRECFCFEEFEHQDGIFSERGFELIRKMKMAPYVFGSAQQIRSFLLNEGYLKTVKVETDDEFPFAKRFSCGV
jgi:hypothetical protein